MLVLSRKLDEQIVIGDSIFLTVVGIKDGVVRIGIDAPPEVSLHRREVFDAMLARDGRVTPGGPPSRERDISRDIPRDPSPPHGPARTTDRLGTPDRGSTPDGPRADGDRDRGCWGYPDGLNGGGK